MTTDANPYPGFRYPAEVVEHAVWLHHCFSLSLRDVELILAARGGVVSYETIREWGLRFGRQFAAALKRRRPRPGDKWHLDEVFIRIRGKLHYLWRAVDRDGRDRPWVPWTPTSKIVAGGVGWGSKTRSRSSAPTRRSTSVRSSTWW